MRVEVYSRGVYLGISLGVDLVRDVCLVILLGDGSGEGLMEE